MTAERDPRIYFAAERTLLAWIRTGLAMMGFGFVVARFGLFLREMSATGGQPGPATGSGSLWAGVALVLLGVAVNVHAALAHVRFSRRFHRGEAAEHDHRFSALTASILAAVGMAMAVYLILR